MVWTVDMPSFTFGFLIGLIILLANWIGKGADKNEH